MKREFGDPAFAARVKAWAATVHWHTVTTENAWNEMCRGIAHRAGFTLVGAGSTRVAVLGPDGLVYKAPLKEADVDPSSRWASYNQGTSQTEAAFFDIVSDLPWAPDFNLLCGSVVVMPRYRVLNDRVYDEKRLYWDEIIEVIGARCGDLGPSNVGFREDGSYVLIDGGEGRLT